VNDQIMQHGCGTGSVEPDIGEMTIVEYAGDVVSSSHAPKEDSGGCLVETCHETVDLTRLQKAILIGAGCLQEGGVDVLRGQPETVED
jgi:hypothetical protein